MGSARRQDILEAALEVFAERGFKNASIDAVAERAGLTRQGVMHYFPSKKRLLLEMLAFREQLNREHLDREHLADHPVGEDLPADFAAAVAFEQSHPSFATVYSVVMAEAVTGQEPARGYVGDRLHSLQAHLTARLTERYGERLPSGLSPSTAATAVLALVEGIHQWWLMDPEPDEDHYPGIVRDTLSVLFGLTEDGPGSEDGGGPRHAPVVNG
ncbi:MAG TPA: TetR/AcrR family transcriptional regulator [Streptomyces sp.]|uniref:TetR/AcrR family transcriptional regulator n=1 Tax=Streptomyces sp. TaxID=1931 RepID=UPI002BE44399|nr:TetR/AcrR family transcriptional regulator [Streptomyces sp.]HWU08175.1 TetR/AcrR family transcriptional regulator [Streptomyces sp.]